MRGEADALVAALTPQLRESGSWHFGVAGDLATACALGGAHDEALEFLGSAIDLGWIHADFFAKHDRSFEKLWDDERFERLMARARQKLAAFEE